MVFPERLGAFRFWCQKVLPLVYDDSLSYYELLCKVVKYLNDTMQAVNDLTDVVEDFLDSGEFTQAIEDKLDEMAEDGTLAELINQEVFGEINEELADLNTRVDSLDDKSWVIFGDSYGESSSGFIDLCGTALGYDSDHWRKYAPSGYGFSGGVGAWYNLVTNLQLHPPLPTLRRIREACNYTISAGNPELPIRKRWLLKIRYLREAL